MITKYILSFLLMCTVVTGQMEYWSPYGSADTSGHYTGQVASASGYPHQMSPLSSDLNSFYPHHYGSPARQFTSPLIARAYPPTAPLIPVHTGCSADSPAKIDWGDCPSLESKDEDKKAKEEKQKECMKNLELNENTTFTQLTPVLQNRVRECTLRKDELINEAGKYNYDKAKEKLQAKGLPENLSQKIEEAHVECKIEAEQKFRNSATSLAEVDSYNECMDFHLAMLCKIKVIKNEVKVSNANSFHGIAPVPFASPANVHSSHDFGGVMNKLSILSQALRR